ICPPNNVKIGHAEPEKIDQAILVILHDARHDSIALPARPFAAGFQTSPMVEFNEVFKYGTRCVFGTPPARRQ
ncbi:hypothetical protein, partial [Klebsiella pneumoniae]|uniref:hypothetical protein n=1 Tax=Klebsiella pneumoniae TaxID=573 RepID=UPI0030DD40DA